jgi:hypothetical protein
MNTAEEYDLCVHSEAESNGIGYLINLPSLVQAGEQSWLW